MQLERLEDGQRRVTSITEVQRMEVDVITLQELFAFKVEQVTGERVVIGTLGSTGLRPTFLHKFEKRGIALPAGLFHEAELAAALQRERAMRRASLGLGLVAAAAGAAAGKRVGARRAAPPRRGRRLDLPERARTS